MSTVEGGGRKWQDLESTQPQGGQQLGVKVFDHTQKTSRTFTELFTLAKVTTSEGETLFVNRRSLKKFLDRNKHTADTLGIKRYMWTSTIVDKLTQGSQKNFQKKFEKLYLQQDVENPREAVKNFIRECRVSGDKESTDFASAIVEVLNLREVNHAVLQALFSELDEEARLPVGQLSCINNDILGKLWCNLDSEVFAELCETKDATKLYNILMAVCQHGSSLVNFKTVAKKVGDVSKHREPYIHTPLTLAIENKNKEVVIELLFAYNADPFVEKGEWSTNDVNTVLSGTEQSPLAVAIESGDLEIIDFIMQKEVKQANPSRSYNEDLLKIALDKECSQSTISKLLRHNRVQTINQDHIMRAILNGNFVVVHELLNNKKAKDLQLNATHLEKALDNFQDCDESGKEKKAHLKAIIFELAKSEKFNPKDLSLRAVEKVSEDDGEIIIDLCMKGCFNKGHLLYATKNYVNNGVLQLLEKYLKEPYSTLFCCCGRLAWMIREKVLSKERWPLISSSWFSFL